MRAVDVVWPSAIARLPGGLRAPVVPLEHRAEGVPLPDRWLPELLRFHRARLLTRALARGRSAVYDALRRSRAVGPRRRITLATRSPVRDPGRQVDLRLPDTEEVTLDLVEPPHVPREVVRTSVHREAVDGGSEAHDELGVVHEPS